MALGSTHEQTITELVDMKHLRSWIYAATLARKSFQERFPDRGATAARGKMVVLRLLHRNHSLRQHIFSQLVFSKPYATIHVCTTEEVVLQAVCFSIEQRILKPYQASNTLLLQQINLKSKEAAYFPTAEKIDIIPSHALSHT